MGGDRRIDQVAAKPAKTRKRPVFVGPGEPGIADDVRDHNRRELSGLAHCAGSGNLLAACPAACRCWRSVEIAAGATEAARMRAEARATAETIVWTETLMVRPTPGQPRAFSSQPSRY
jgi:hypothetical protein